MNFNSRFASYFSNEVTSVLHYTIRNGLTSWWSQLTEYHELVLIGVPILFEKLLNINDVAGLSGLRPNRMTRPHLDLHTHLGN